MMELSGSQFELEYLEPRSRSNTLFSTKSSLLHQRCYSARELSPDVELEDRLNGSEGFKQEVQENDASDLIGVDTGRAWFSVAGAFLSAAIIGGIERSFGVQTLFLQEHFNATPLVVSWIGALCTMLRFLFGTASGLLCARYGCASVAGCGAILFALGIFLSSFSPNVELLYLTYGIMPGIGGSMVYISGSLMVNENFDRLRGRANGIYLAGSGAGSFSMPIIIQYLHSSYGMRGEILILSAIAAHILITSGLFFVSTLAKKEPDQDHNSELKILDPNDVETNSDPNTLSEKSGKLAKLKKVLGCGSTNDEKKVPLPAFLILISSICLVYMGLMACIFGLPSLARERGVSSTNAALLLSITGIWDLIGRSTSGLIFDKFVDWRKHMYAGSYIMIALANFLLPSMSHFYQFVMVISITGYFGGVMIAMRSIVCVEVVGKQALKLYFGFLVTAQGIGVLIGPPAASALQSLFRDSRASFYFCGVVQVLGAILLSIHIISTRNAKTADSRDD